jgi:hypothetical protein
MAGRILIVVTAPVWAVGIFVVMCVWAIIAFPLLGLSFIFGPGSRPGRWYSAWMGYE